MTELSEEDLIETLRIWAEIINDGVFPDEVSVEAQMKMVPKLIEKLTALQLSGQLSDAEGAAIGTKFGRMIFFQMASRRGQYTGKGVKLGDAESEVCRFQAPGSQRWRVVYGDLSVKDAQ
jgi:hypothetical protein